MIVPQQLQFRPEDLPQVKTPILTALNTFLRQLRDGLSNRLTLTQNNAASIRGQNITVTSPWTAFSFTHGLPSGRCTDLVPTYIQDTAAIPTFPSPTWPVWQDNGDGTVTIKNIGGLTAGKTYAFRFLCLSEPA